MPVSVDERLVRFAATGDLLLASDVAGTSSRRAPADIFGDVTEVLTDRDLVLGNLECTLPGDGETVPTEPRVVTTPELVRAIRPAGFNIVALANNHAFDCLHAGFRNIRELLRELNITCFGAGDDLAQAAAPAILELNGIRLAFLGAVDPKTGTSQPARPDHWGVAAMDVDGMVNDIRRTAAQVHHVILCLHWGEERFLIPSPTQIDQAHRLAEAGASLIIGHHPHVIQGMETYHDVPIVYSLGNFVACDVPYADGDKLTWSRRERTGCLLLAELTADEVRNVRQVPSYDSGQTVNIDRTGHGDRLIARANRVLARGVTPGRYRREHLWVKTIKPALQHLRWSRLKTMRLSRIRQALSGMAKAPRAR